MHELVSQNRSVVSRQAPYHDASVPIDPPLVALHLDERRSSLAFSFLVFFTFVVFVAPQNAYSFLQPLHLARVSVLLAAAAYLGRERTRGEALFPQSRQFRQLLLFTLLILLSIPLSLWPGGSFQMVLDLYGKSLVACVLTTQLLDSLDRWKRMVWWMILFGIAISFIGVRGGWSDELVEGYRIEGGWGGLAANPNDFALTVNLLIPFALAFYSLSSWGWKRLVCAVFLISAVWGILLSYSRGGLITLVAIVLIFLTKSIRREGAIGYLVPTFMVLVGLFVLAPGGWSERIESITDFSKDRTGSAQERWANTERTLAVISEAPLLGIGAGMNVLALNEKGGDWGRVHNVYLQIASEIGIPGGVVFVLLLSTLVKSARQLQRRLFDEEANREIAALAFACEGALLAFAVAALFHPVAYHFYFYYVAGLTMALARIASAGDETREGVESVGAASLAASGVG